MPLPDLVAGLAAIEARGACTDAERRAATLLRDELRARGAPARVETIWIRPQWPAAWALHAALGVVGTLLSVGVPVAGLAVLAATLVSFVLDVSGRAHLLRALLPRRATQLVSSEPPPPRDRIRRVVTASLDAPRTGAVFAPRYARLRPYAPALATVALAILTGLAIARVAGAGGQAIGAAQLAPTVVLLLAAAALTDIALSPPSPGADAEASAVAAALDVAEALREAPPRNLDAELVLAGAGDGLQLGFRGYVHSRRFPAERVAVVAISACGHGRPRVFTTTGLLVPQRLHPRLIALAAPAPTARGSLSGALPARRARWPAIAVGADAPDGRRATDMPEKVQGASVDATVDLCLRLISRLDRDLSPGAEASRLSAVDR